MLDATLPNAWIIIIRCNSMSQHFFCVAHHLILLMDPFRIQKVIFYRGMDKNCDKKPFYFPIKPFQFRGHYYSCRPIHREKSHTSCSCGGRLMRTPLVSLRSRSLERPGNYKHMWPLRNRSITLPTFRTTLVNHFFNPRLAIMEL